VKRTGRLLAFLIGPLALWLGGGGGVAAGEVHISTAGEIFNAPVTSLREARFRFIYLQQLDFSCGSAALASLLTFHYNRPTTEREALLAMWKAGDQAKIQRLGFSLLDMKKYLATRGLRADGFQVPFDNLIKARIPAIVLIDTNGYKHFVIVKGVRGDDVLVGDPALGVNVVPRSRFEAMWNGILFIIRDDVRIAQSTFNRDEEWTVRGKAPFGTALARDGLATFTMMLPGRNEF